MKNGDFSGLVDAQGRLIIIYDPATGRDVNGVWTRDPFPGNSIPADRINPTARAIMQYYPDPNDTTAGVAPWQQNLDYAEHFNKDLFWNWVGKVDHNFSANDRAFFRWGENERNEVAQSRNAIRSGPAQDGQLPLMARQPRARRRLGARLRRRDGVQPARQLHLLPGVELFRRTRSASMRRSSGPSSLVSQMPSQAIGGIFPRIELDRVRRACRAARARTGTGTTRSSRTCR